MFDQSKQLLRSRAMSLLRAACSKRAAALLLSAVLGVGASASTLSFNQATGDYYVNMKSGALGLLDTLQLDGSIRRFKIYDPGGAEESFAFRYKTDGDTESHLYSTIYIFHPLEGYDVFIKHISSSSHKYYAGSVRDSLSGYNYYVMEKPGLSEYGYQYKNDYSATTPLQKNLLVINANYQKVDETPLDWEFELSMLEGKGTSENPYILHNATDWSIAADLINQGGLVGCYFKLSDSFDNSTAVTVPFGVDTCHFQGTFDGNGQTLNVNLTSVAGQGTAPFHYIENATISDLCVTGTISGKDKHTGGLAGFAYGINLIQNCRVEATISNSKNRYLGGVLAHGITSTTTVRGCLFAGTLTGSNFVHSAGIWSWSDAANPTVLDCMEMGRYTGVASMHPIALLNNYGSATRCFYLQPQVGSPNHLGDMSGTRMVYGITTASGLTATLSGTPTSYDVAGLDVYDDGVVANGDDMYAATGATVTLSGAAERTGYRRAYLVSTAERTDTVLGNTFTMPASAVSITSTYIAIEYDIDYVLNGGTLSANADTLFTIESDSITLIAPTRTGYTFGGWYTTAACTGDSVTGISAGSTGDRTYYAKWTRIVYDIDYVLNGGTLSANADTLFTIESDTIALMVPTRTGYTFGGWYTTANCRGNSVTSISAGSTGDRTYYAKWTCIVYDIDYVLNSGTLSANADTHFTIESDSINLIAPTRTGYTFGGWYTTAACTGDSVTGISAGSTGDRTYYAKWTRIVYDIDYVLNGGTLSANADTLFTIESHTISLIAPTRTGYTFGGWYPTANCKGNSVTGISAGSTGDRTYYAKWTRDEYDIDYELNGGTLQMATPADAAYYQMMFYVTELFIWDSGTSFTGSDIPVETISCNGIQLVKDEAEGLWKCRLPISTQKISFEVTIDGKKCAMETSPLYGEYDWNVHIDGQELSYHYIASQVCPTGAPSSYNVESSGIKLDNPTRQGYTFDGWYTTADCTGEAVDSIPACSTGDRTFYAKWTRSSYNIQYELNGGSLKMATPADTAYYLVDYNFDVCENYLVFGCGNLNLDPGTEEAAWWVCCNGVCSQPQGLDGVFRLPANTQYLSFGFNGSYYYAARYNDVVNNYYNYYYFKESFKTEQEAIAAHSTLCAYHIGKDLPMEEIPTMNFVYNAALIHPKGCALSEYYVNGDSITLIAPTRTGYTFGGWYTTAACTGDSVTGISAGSTGDRTYYAKWTRDEYDIDYVLNGGTLSANADTLFTIESDSITLIAPTRTGYTFGGWYTTADCTGDRVTGISAGSMGDRTYYAKWTCIVYDIDYVLNSGTLSANADTLFTIESDSITLIAPTRTGYTFGGWYTTPDCTGDSVTGISAGSTGDRTYYAEWTLDEYDINYELNGGTFSRYAITQFTVESDSITLIAPTRTGYTFGGWYTTAACTGDRVTGISAGSTGDRTYYAKWIMEVKYDIDINYLTSGGEVMVITTNSGNATEATAGDDLNILVNPDSNYRLLSLSVTDAEGNELEITDELEGFYAGAKCKNIFLCFMPSSNVTVNVAFEPLPQFPLQWESGDCMVVLDAEGTLTVSGEGAMSDYSTSQRPGWLYYDNCIDRIVVADGVTRLGAYAFDSCSYAASVFVRDEEPQAIAAYALDSTVVGFTIFVPTGSVNAYRTADGWSDYKAYIQGNPFPLQWESGDCIVTLAESATLTVSGEGAMADYHAKSGLVPDWYLYSNFIKRIEVKEGVTKVGDFCFPLCVFVNQVELPASLDSIGNCAFMYYLSLTTLELPDNIRSIGKAAFGASSCLMQVKLPKNLQSLGQGAFTQCSMLNYVVLPSGLTRLEQEVFTDCSRLSGVELPDALDYIVNRAFSDCSNLTSIIIPERVDTIESDAFSGASSLADIYCYASPTQLAWLDNDSQSYMSQKATRCHVPADSLEAFNAKWNNGSETDLNLTFVGDLEDYGFVRLNSRGYATFSHSNDVEMIAGADAYLCVADIEQQTITCSALNQAIPAGTGVLLSGTAGRQATYHRVDQAPAVTSDNDLLPTTTAEENVTDVPAGFNYVLNGNLFLHYTGSAFVANKAYFNFESAVYAPQMRIIFDDLTESTEESTSGIVDTESAPATDAIYSLSGARTELRQGLQVRRGKVVMVK